jgi:hypothetical protein
MTLTLTKKNLKLIKIKRKSLKTYFFEFKNDQHLYQ